MIRFPLCIFGKHRVKRGAAHYDGRLFRGACRHCGVDMIKDGHSGDWRTLTPDDPPPDAI